MTLPTLADLITELDNDLDLTDEVMITSAEKIANFNKGIDEAEQLVHNLCEDYLLQKEPLSMVSGTAEYSLPSNIYANKIRKIIYDNGSTTYEIRKIRDLAKIPDVQDSDDLRYLIYTNSSGVQKILLYPTPAETTSTYVTIWFIGNANRLSVDADVMNIPEAKAYVLTRAKLECARKEGHPAQVALEGEVERQRQLLVTTLSAMTPDEDTKLTLDTSYYDDQDFGGW